MVSLLLAVIYLSFISLGLPDSLLGSGWPVMQGELGVPLSYAGVLSMIVAGCTIVSSLSSDFITRKLNPGLVTALSVAMTAVSLFGYSVSASFPALCLWSVPYGLGAAPVYPCIIHSTPVNFGRENSQALVSIQMASAYCGTTLAPPVFGLIAEHISLALYPVYLALFALLMLVMTSRMYKILDRA